MTWIDHSIWWQVYPLGFTGAAVRPSGEAERTLTHRLGHLTSWLDHPIQLGCNGLLLGPIFASETHGYDTTDFYAIDPRLGDDADIDNLIATAHEKGLSVVFDGVFNHVGVTHPLYLKALEGGPESPEARLFRLEWTPEGARPANFEGHGSLVTLNHDAPEIVDLIADVMLHWLRRGIQGWRLDAAYAVPTGFWQQVLPRVRAEFPDAWFVGEVIHGDYPTIVRESSLDSITEYRLWKATWSALKDANFFELDWSLQGHNELMDAFTPMTFIGNHDVNRIATVVGREAAMLAAVILFTVGGIPCVYYGDEYGYTGTKREDWGGDDEVRPMFPTSKTDISPLGAPVLRAYTELIGLRRRHPWLTHARTTAVTLTNTHYVYDVTGPDGERLRVDLGLEGRPQASVSDASGAVVWRLTV